LFCLLCQLRFTCGITSFTILQPHAIFSSVTFLNGCLTGLVLASLLIIELYVAFFSLNQEVSKESSKLSNTEESSLPATQHQDCPQRGGDS
jgi:hypothetical protein